MSFVSELRRRHVVKVAIAYVTVGFAVLQGAALLLPTMDVPEWTFRVIVAVVLLGFPVALVLAWALEMTPDGVVRTAPPEKGEGESGGRSDGAVSDDSIAVLPFGNLSDVDDGEYFSDGITEEILSALSKVRRLEVISRTSVMRYKGTTKGIREIAGDLAVAHVVEGSVRRAGERVRINAQLIDARTDRQLWSETYDRDLDDIFAIQSDVAERIVRSLRVTLTPAEKERLGSRPTASVEAYQWYLKGRHSLALRTEEALRRAITEFDRAIEEDPDFAQAWVGRADGWALLPSYSMEPVDSAVAEARRSARRALEIQPGLGEAHAALGMAAQSMWEWDESEREIQRALELDPGYAPAHHWLAINQLIRGRYDEAAETLEGALELDPLSIPLHMALGVAHLYSGSLDEAMRVNRNALEIEPGSLTLRWNLVETLEVTGRWNEAIEVMETLSRLHPPEMPPGRAEMIRNGFEEGGVTGYWKARLEGAGRGEAVFVREFKRAVALAQLGRLDEAMDEIDRIVGRKDAMAIQIPHDPRLEPVRSHPRYDSVRERLGIG